MLLAAPILLASLAVGLMIIAMFQAATQINEMTLSFVPKLMVVAIVMMAPDPGCCARSPGSCGAWSRTSPIDRVRMEFTESPRSTSGWPISSGRWCASRPC